MTDHTLSLLDAIQVAMEAEQKAAAFYADAAKRTTIVARGLFEQLAEFERHHYDKLVVLVKSLREEGAFTPYEGRELVLPAQGEVKDPIEEAQRMSLMDIITLALDVERQAEERYTALAGQTDDPSGRAMFTRLAAEEHIHHRILTDAYWSLNDHGVWVWPKV